jgi:hypothetical protein
MTRHAVAGWVIMILVAGCARFGDVTPPAGLATAQSAQAATVTQAPPASPTQAPAAAGAPMASGAATTGAISGAVTLGPDGAPPPEGLEVTLHGLEEGQEVFARTAALAADGTYAFKDLEIAAGRLYVVTAAWDGVVYPSEAAHLSDSQPSLDLPLVVYGTTADDSAVRLARLHLLVDFSLADRLQIVELWVLSNAGRATVAPVDGAGGVAVTLPAGAASLRFPESEAVDRFQPAGDGFIDTQPLLPGEATGQVVFSYDLPYDGDLTLSRQMGYPLEAAVLMIPGDGVRVEAQGLQDLGLRQVAGESLHQYSLGAVDAGDELAIRLRGTPQAGAAAGGGRSALGTGIGVAVLVAALIVAGLAWPRGSAHNRAGAAAEGRVAGDAEAVLREIAALDDDHAAGRVDEAAYRSRRLALKERARAKMQERHD